VIEASRQVLDVVGAPEIVVNNAGIVHRNTRIEDVSLQSWTEVVDTNLTGPFLVTRAFLPSMRARDAGRFVFVASISSTIGSPGAASYAASKWGVVGLAKSLAEELRGTRLCAMSVLPGSVDTDMLKGSGFPPLMEADDVAKTIVFAALDAPSAMNGASLEVFG
jgi:3-oxoacyl-[acyl-carrier protein] reductase